MRLIFLHLVPKSKPGSQAGQARLTWSIPALSAAAGARFRCPDASNRSVYFPLVDQITFLPDNRYNYDLAKISRTKKQTIETEMGEKVEKTILAENRPLVDQVCFFAR